MINWQTTLPGLITAIVNIVILFGLEIDEKSKTLLVASTTTIGLFIVSIFAKDKNK